MSSHREITLSVTVLLNLFSGTSFSRCLGESSYSCLTSGSHLHNTNRLNIEKSVSSALQFSKLKLDLIEVSLLYQVGSLPLGEGLSLIVQCSISSQTLQLANLVSDTCRVGGHLGSWGDKKRNDQRWVGSAMSWLLALWCWQRLKADSFFRGHSYECLRDLPLPTHASRCRPRAVP